MSLYGERNVAINRLKLGDSFGVGYGRATDVALYCEVTGVGVNLVEFYVVNGDWDGTLRHDGTLTVTKTGSSFTDNHVLYRGPIPFSPYDYDKAIEYMNTFVPLPWHDRVVHRVRNGIRTWWDRIVKSKDAFVSTYKSYPGKVPTPMPSWWNESTDDEDEDDIPF